MACFWHRNSNCSGACRIVICYHGRKRSHFDGQMLRTYCCSTAMRSLFDWRRHCPCCSNWCCLLGCALDHSLYYVTHLDRRLHHSAVHSKYAWTSNYCWCLESPCRQLLDGALYETLSINPCNQVGHELLYAEKQNDSPSKLWWPCWAGSSTVATSAACCFCRTLFQV